MVAVEEARQRAEAVGVPEMLADLSIFRVLLQSPEAAGALGKLLLTLLGRTRFDARLRELVIMRLGWSTGSVYEWTQHWRVARDLGVPDDDLLGVRDWAGYDGFGVVERAVLAATDEIVSTGTISDETWATCASHLDAPGLVELTLVIGLWRMISTVLQSLGVPLEDGVAAWPPDGRAP